MPSCTQCGGEDFVEDCGHFYCVVCHVQSQDIRVEETEFDDVHNVTVTKTPVTASKVKVREAADDKLSRLGRPWTIQEGYQCIIKKQVQKLIELGADEKLDDVVFRLWTAYLSALCVAFCDKEHLVHPSPHLLSRPRESHCGPLDDPVVRKPRRYKYAAPSRETVENVHIRNELGSEEFDEADIPGDDMTGQVTRHCKKAHPYTFCPTPTSVKYTAEWMNLQETLSFLYLGLLFTNNHVTPSELISLAERDLIPFQSAVSCLKDDMKISAHDDKLFNGSILPATSALRIMTTKLIRFLGIYQLPPLPLDVIIHKLILKLDLPAEFHGLVSNLLKEVDVNTSIDVNIHAVKNIEVMAAAFIILTLKLFFGINDSREHFLTENARKLSKLLPNHNLFIWEDWQSHIASKYDIKHQIVNNNILPHNDITDVDKFVEFYHSSLKCKNIGVMRARRQKQFEAVVNPVSELAIRAKELEQKIDSVTMETDNPLDMLNGSLDGSYVHVSPERKRGDLFRCSSIKYLMTTHDLLRETEKGGLTDYTVESSYCGSPERQNDFSDMGSSLITPQQDKMKKKHRKMTRVQQAVDNILSQTNDSLSVLSESEHEEIENIMENIDEESGLYSEYEHQQKVLLEKEVKDRYEFQRHLSYEWLLSVFCKLIKCRVDELEYMLKNFEYFVLDQTSPQTKSHASFKAIYIKPKYQRILKNKKSAKKSLEKSECNMTSDCSF